MLSVHYRWLSVLWLCQILCLGSVLHGAQVEGALAALRAANEGPFEVLEALEAVARLSWSDDEVRFPPQAPHMRARWVPGPAVNAGAELA